MPTNVVHAFRSPCNLIASVGKQSTITFSIGIKTFLAIERQLKINCDWIRLWNKVSFEFIYQHTKILETNLTNVFSLILNKYILHYTHSLCRNASVIFKILWFFPLKSCFLKDFIVILAMNFHFSDLLIYNNPIWLYENKKKNNAFRTSNSFKSI